MKWIGRQFLWCLLPAAIAPVLVYVFSRGRATPERIALTFATSYIFALSIAIPLEYMLHRIVPRLRGRPTWITTPLYGLTLLAFAFGGTLLGATIICSLGLVPWAGFWGMYREAVKISVLLTFMFGIGGLAASAMEHRLNEANALLRQKEEDERRARAIATEARLMSLESRVHPHFLFNAINSILALIRDDPRRAEDLLERMAALLRFSLDTTQGRLVPLAKELAIVRDYLEIEQARFGDRLRFEMSGEAEAEVPPLSIQTLVENCVKYAVSPRREGGRIRVEVRAADDQRVEITVADDGAGFDESAVSPGHGLALLRERLQGLGVLELQRRPDGMAVRVKVPGKVAAAV